MFDNMRHDAILRRGLQERVLMMRQTTCLVEAFNISKGACLKANAPIAWLVGSARRAPERLALNNEVVAFSMTSDAATTMTSRWFSFEPVSCRQNSS